MAFLDKFKQKNSLETIEFKSGKQAFEIAFKNAIDQGKSMIDAAKEASEFSETICRHLDLPHVIEPPKKGFDKWEQEFEKWDRGCQKFIGKPLPEVAILIATLIASGAGASALGALTEAKIHENNNNNNEINYEEVRDGGSI